MGIIFYQYYDSFLFFKFSYLFFECIRFYVCVYNMCVGISITIIMFYYFHLCFVIWVILWKLYELIFNWYWFYTTKMYTQNIASITGYFVCCATIDIGHRQMKLFCFFFFRGFLIKQVF